MTPLVKRNLLVFFKDKASVFFSLLSVLIIIGLYMLFLGDVWVQSFEGAPGVRFLMDSWIMAGVLAVSSVTTTMGALGIMVDDRVRKYNKDIIASPLRRSSIAGGYIFSAFAIGVVMSVVTLVLAELFIVTSGGALLPFSALLKMLGLILLSSLTSTSMVLFLVGFFKSNNAFAVASTIIGTMIGFLTGIYMPIGQLPGAVQWVVRLFPTSHGASLMRQVMMAEPMAATFANAPAEAVQVFREDMGVTLKFGSMEITPILSLGFMVLAGIVFFGLAILRLSKKDKGN